MKESIFFSVIIPVFNAQKYVGETIQSVLNQTYPNFELIVVNDGSTDKSLQAIQKYADSRIKVITIKNSGVSVARNTGIKNAKYNYVAFLDADDYWAEAYLESIVEVIHKYPNEKLFQTGRNYVYPNNSVRYYNPLIPAEGKHNVVDYIEIIHNHEPPIHSSCIVIHKDLFYESGLFKAGQKKFEDHDLWLRLCANHNLVFYNKNLSFYRKEVENAATSSWKIRIQDLHEYVKTMDLVKSKIKKDSPKKAKLLEQFANRLILVLFTREYPSYKRADRRAFLNTAKKVVSTPYYYFLELINLFPNYILQRVVRRFWKLP